MCALIIIYFRINFDVVVANYTGDESLELGSEISGLVLYHEKDLIITWKCLNGKKVNNGTITHLPVVFIL